MSRKIKVIDEIEYILENEANPKIDYQDDEEYGYIDFCVDYINEIDEDGYSPPKYLLLDGTLEDMIDSALEDINQDDQYKPMPIYDYDEVNMETIYVLPTIKDSITIKELEEYKKTRFSQRIEKK